jgi:FkbM family methyltransferase
LFFAKKGYEVIGFEPLKEAYKDSLVNIELNKDLKQNIRMINKAISCKNGEIKIYKDEDNSGSSSQFVEQADYDLAEAITLEKAIETYEITPYILKIDCEGCEFDIILNSDLSMFKEIHFEFHSTITGISGQKILSALENQGFKTAYIDGDLDDIGVVKMIRD